MTLIEVPVQIAVPDLLRAMEKLPATELDELLQEARLLQKRRQSEKALHAVIQQQLPVERATRLRELSQKQEEERITAAERLELLQITDEVEQADVVRAEALLALAQQRQLSITELLRQLNLERSLG